ncbi:MAG: helix-turn-helix domain-containing protein [Ferruginibacter sp.]
MNLEFFIPANKALQKYIEGYYFIAANNEAGLLNYWTFPNNFFILSISQNIDIVIEEKKLVVKPGSQENIVVNYVASYTKPIEVVYEEPVNEITIYFKPLGINQFIENTEPLFKDKNAANFIPFPDFTAQMKQIFSLENRTAQTEALEKYWLSKLLDKQPSILENVLADVEADLRIDDIATKYNFSRQYLHKLFIKNIGKSPVEYRKIHRFRNSIITQKRAASLTQVTYDNSFYDQSHFIKDFKQFTNINPHSFFRKVDTAKENVWLFI